MKRIYFLTVLIAFITSCTGEEKKPFSGEPQLADRFIADSIEQPYTIQCSFRDRAGNLWFGTTGGKGVFRYDAKGEVTNFSVNDGLVSQDIYSIYEDKTGNMWFGTLEGVSWYDGKNFTHLSVPEMEGSSLDPLWRLPNALPPSYWPSAKSVLSILEDKAGNMWFGTAGAGVFRYGKCQTNAASSKCFTNFLYTNFSTGAMIHPDHLIRNGISSILEDRNGNIWFGSYSHGGVYRYDPASGVFYNFAKKDGLSDDRINALLEDKNGNIWAATRQAGVCRYDPNSGTFTNNPYMDGLESRWISSIAEDKSGNIWFGGDKDLDGMDGGLCRYDGKTFVSAVMKEGMEWNITTLIQDNNGQLWFGTRNGQLWRYNLSTKTFTNMTDKVPRR